MQSSAKTVDAYIQELPAERKGAISKLRAQLRKNLPKGFKEVMYYGMISYIVPHSIYPKGYHVDPKTPLPFISLASQKNHVAVYHMGIYTDPDLLSWFQKEYADLGIGKLDMGKSCIRFKNPAKIPFDLIGLLSSKMEVQDWIDKYEATIWQKGAKA